MTSTLFLALRHPAQAPAVDVRSDACRVSNVSGRGATDGAAKPPGEDWTVLFNGKDLSGWTNIGKEKWEIEDGTLHGVAVTREYGYLQTDKSYKDFQLSLRFKCEGDGNSGVFFHVNFKPGTPQVTKGPQFEIDCTLGHHTGGVYEQTRKWIVWPAPENESVVRPGEWNDYLITVVGNHYISRLNGVADGGLHRSAAGERRRSDRAAIAFGRAGEHAIQGHHHSGLVKR